MTEKSKIQLTEQEIQEINELRDQYATLTAKFGQLKIEQILVEEQLKRLSELETAYKEEYLTTQVKEEAFGNTITGKYGEGNIDVEAGFFLPI
jgi:hypothetical protein